MIKQFTEIRSIGKFENYKSSEHKWNKYNFIYSDNGQGKSTLTSILRSYSDNNPKIIIGRKTIGTTDEIVCKFETTTSFKTFKNSTWDANDPHFLIFDAQFVNQNIYSGMHVGIDHRRRLYQFIIGEAAIHLNEEVNLVADEIARINTKVNEKKADLNKLIGMDIKLEEFLALEKTENVDNVISAKEKEVQALVDKDKILKKQKLVKIDLPVFSAASTKTLLSKNIENISKESESKVRSHIHNKLDKNGEQWIKQGVLYQNKFDKCPFCESDTKSNALISAYSDYFNEAYNDLKVEIETHEKTILDQFNEVLTERIKKVLSENDLSIEFWEQYLPVSLLIEDLEQGDFFPIITHENFSDFYASFTIPLEQLFSEKRKAPLDKINDGNLEKTIVLYNKIKTQVDSYNGLVDTQNTIIQNHKNDLGTSDLETEKKSLMRLKFVKLRHTQEALKKCEEYLQLCQEKDALVEKKELARKKLDEETQKIPSEYQSRINFFLERFGAEFRIVDHKKVNPSGQAATEYKLMLKGVEITLGDNKTPEEITSFQNTLSEGDKNTLAFSYFLARLESETKLSEKILVFDDPISSLDRFRRTWTRNILRQFGEESKQLIVLSHDPSFIEELAHTFRGTDPKCLEILWDPERTSSVLKVTTISDLNKNDYIRNIEKVRNYVTKKAGSPEDVKARLRHLCEHYLRKKYPRSFVRKDNLGSMVEQIRNADLTDRESEEKIRLGDLTAINDYSIEENHAQDGQSGRIDEVELTSQCKLTLDLIGESLCVAQ